jgi:hypothetical protein
MAIHLALAAAVHVQPAGAVTVTLADPPSVGISAWTGASVYEHTGVGSVGDVLLQLRTTRKREVATDAWASSRDGMTHSDLCLSNRQTAAVPETLWILEGGQRDAGRAAGFPPRPAGHCTTSCPVMPRRVSPNPATGSRRT